MPSCRMSNDEFDLEIQYQAIPRWSPSGDKVYGDSLRNIFGNNDRTSKS
jgi:hypothetical protein